MKQNKYNLDTPCLILDMDILEKNIEKMQADASAAGKNLRPHAKTHKCSSLARLQINSGAVGICAAKVSEAEALVNTGISKVLLTGPVTTTRKIERLLDLLPKAPGLIVTVDNPENIVMLNKALQERDLSMYVLLDIDVGLNRTGVNIGNAEELADLIISMPYLNLRGIQAYAGHLQHIPLYKDRKRASLECLAGPVRLFNKLKTAVPGFAIFSTSGTGTFGIDAAINEITEFQTGSYVCMDTEYLDIGSDDNETRFTAFEPALRLLATVVSVNHSGFVTVDAGLKSLYRDGGIPEIITPEYATLQYDWFGDEYGKISAPDGQELPHLGTVLELVVSHCDPTINLFDKYHLTRGKKVCGTWPIDLRGCSQ